MDSRTDSPVLPERARPSNSLLTSFLIQAAANATGTIVGGAILGGAAIRFGIFRPSNQVLYQLEELAWALGLATPAVALVAVAGTWLLNWLDPDRRDRRRLILIAALQTIFWVGVAVTALGHLVWQLAYGGFNMLGFLAVLPVIGIFLFAVFAVRAYGQGRGKKQALGREERARD